MNKKIIYLIGAIVGVAAVTLLTSQKPENIPVVEVSPTALPVNGLADVTASSTATIIAPVVTPDMTDAPVDSGTAATDPSMAPAGADELPVGAEVEPQADTNPMSTEADEKIVPPSEGQ